MGLAKTVRLADVNCRAESRVFAQRLASFTSRRIFMAITDNTRTMVSVRRGIGQIDVRVHHMFTRAPLAVIEALGRYCETADRRASRVLGRFIASKEQFVRRNVRSNRIHSHGGLSACPQGAVYDLGGIFDDLNARFFGGRLTARIGWGARRVLQHRPRSVRLGSYSVEDRLIRIHPCLDRPCVPRFFVESVVFHEMLHERHLVWRQNGRRRFHTQEFLRDERRFPDYARAKQWEKENVAQLLG